MCGIVGYLSQDRSDVLRLGLESLKRLEYRGYDSAGFAAWDSDKKKVFCLKAVGQISELEKKLGDNNFVSGGPVILHTRWATHGGITEANAHPHCGGRQNIWLAHNGIIENYRQLKDWLMKEGHKFTSQTDTEVLAHLIEKFFTGNLEEAVRRALGYVKGTYGIVVIARDDPGKIVAARLSSPLLLGLTKGGYLVASDPSAIVAHSRKVVYLEDGEVATITPDGFSLLKKKNPQTEEIDGDFQEAHRGDYAHFMLKEIMEGPATIENAIKGRLIAEDGKVKLGGLQTVEKKLREIKKIILVGCGTAFHAAKIGEYMLEEYAGLSAKAEIASEIRYRQPVLNRDTAAIFISQSGETADTLAVLREMKEKGILTLGITNAVGSSQARETAAGVYTRSGPEVAVASTKAFLGQLAVLSLLTVYLGRQRKMSMVIGRRIVSELANLPELAEQILKQSAEIENLAGKYKQYQNFWFTGRKYNFPIALEGALKLKEISYRHAEGVAGGELKHGSIALIDKNFPTIALCPNDSVYEKMISNVQEIKARKGRVLALASRNDRQIKKVADEVIYLPKTLEMLTPMLTVIPLHLFAYYLSLGLGRDIDKPRNLAKSVTVE